MKSFRSLLALVALLPPCFGCTPEPTPPPVVRVAYAPHDHHAALYIAALAPQYFKEHGGLYLKEIVARKDFELKEGDKTLAILRVDSSTGGAELIRKLAEDQFDVSLGGFPAMVQAIDTGAPIKVISPLMMGGTGLVVSKALGVGSWSEFVAAAQKRGKHPPLKIGHQAEGSVQSMALVEALNREKISLSQSDAPIKLEDLHGPKNLIPSLKSGVVEGFVAMQPYLAMAEEENAGTFIGFLEDFEDEAGGGFYPCCAVAGRNGFLAAQPEVSQKLITLLLRSSRYIATHPKEAAASVAAWLGNKANVEEKSLPTIHFASSLDTLWQRGSLRWVERMVRNGKLTGSVKAAFQKSETDGVIYDKPLFDKALKDL